MQEAHELIYWRGRLYDQQTEQRLEFQAGTRLMVVVPPGQVLPSPDPPPPIRTTEMQEAELKLTSRYYDQVGKRGDELLVRISCGRNPAEGEEDLLLRVELLEDLYLYDKPDRSRPYGSEFAACQCKVVADVSGQMPPYAFPSGLSLNDLYKNAYLAFRQDGGNPSCNASVEFRWKHPDWGWTAFTAVKTDFEAEVKRLFPEKA